MKIKTILLSALALLFIVGSITFVVPLLARPQPTHGVLLQSPQPLENFTLTNTDGQRVQLADLRGKYLLFYFGYTFCPDVCPTTLAELRKAKQALGSDSDQVQVIMVSVDPERDTPQRLKRYMTAFNAYFMALTGTEEELAAVASAFGIFYEKHEGSAATSYLVDHTATVIAVDPEGYVRMIFPFGTSGEAMAADLHALLY